MFPAREEARDCRTANHPYLQPPNVETKKENNNASCKTRNQTPRQAQKNIRPRKRVLPHKIKALPLSKRSGGARAEVRLLRTQAAQAPIPFTLDRAHRR